LSAPAVSVCDSREPDKDPLETGDSFLNITAKESNMIRTKLARTLTLAGFVPAGKLSHSYRSLLPLLALCLATAAWSQTALGPRGLHRRSLAPGAIPSAKPSAEAPASSQYHFITIGIPGSTYAEAFINDARLVAGLYKDASSVYHGFVWQSGTFQTVDYPGAAYTNLAVVNNRGVAIGWYGDGTSEYAVTYTAAGGTWTVLPNIPGYPENEGYGINDAGVAVGNAYSADYSTNVAWIWDPATQLYSFFAVPGAAQYSTSPNAINDKGQMAGTFCTTEPCYDASFEEYGFLKQGETYTTIGAPSAGGSDAIGINNGGTIVGEWWDSTVYANQGFILTSAGLFTTVDYPGPEITALLGINDRGDISGNYVAKTGDVQAFVGFRQ
jgi:hypothetical protein